MQSRSCREDDDINKRNRSLIALRERILFVSYLPAPVILDGFYIFVFNFLLDIIREITEEVDTGFVFQRLDIYDIVYKFIFRIKCLVLVKEPIAEGIVFKVVCVFIIAKVPSKSIIFSHFYAQKISSIFVHRCQHLGYKNAFAPKKTTALVYAVVFSAFM